MTRTSWSSGAVSVDSPRRRCWRIMERRYDARERERSGWGERWGAAMREGRRVGVVTPMRWGLARGVD